MISCFIIVFFGFSESQRTVDPLPYFKYTPIVEKFVESLMFPEKCFFVKPEFEIKLLSLATKKSPSRKFSGQALTEAVRLC